MKPQLSVIVASYNAEKTIASCLKSLEDQATTKSFEVIAVDSSTDGTAALVEERFPDVKLYTFPERKYCGGARNQGISVAKADLVAFLDADCVAAPNWVEEILRAHQCPHLAIGGAIANAGPGNLVSWASYFTEFSQWMPDTQATFVADMAAANISYKREAFDTLGPFIEGTYCSDTEFHWRLGKLGQRIRFTSSILITHHSIDRFPRFIRHEYEHGRCFARVRVRSQLFSILRRYAYALCFLPIAIKLFLQVGLRNHKNRIYLPFFMKASPLILLGLLAWSLGECVGYLERQVSVD
jgi:GT2 family glycosyltransferase